MDNMRDNYAITLLKSLFFGGNGGGGGGPVPSQRLYYSEAKTAYDIDSIKYDISEYGSAYIQLEYVSGDTPNEGDHVIVKGSVTGTNTDYIVAGEAYADGYLTAIAAGYVDRATASGTITITENGTVDVSDYATADVNVSGGGGDNTLLVRSLERNSSDTAALVLPSDVTKLANGALRGGYWGSITAPGVLTAEQNAFYSLQGSNISVSLANCRTLGGSCFYGSSGLKTMDAPSLTSIGDQCFRNCSNLEWNDMPGNITTLGTRAFQGTKVSFMSIPEGVYNIPDFCFSGCSQLDYLDIYCPTEGSLRIGQYAFNNSGLSTVRFYARAMNIDSHAFSDCSNLTDIFVPWSEGEVFGAPWGASGATVHYNTV